MGMPNRCMYLQCRSSLQVVCLLSKPSADVDAHQQHQTHTYDTCYLPFYYFCTAGLNRDPNSTALPSIPLYTSIVYYKKHEPHS